MREGKTIQSLINGLFRKAFVKKISPLGNPAKKRTKIKKK
jgi:hypothetical protein